MMAKNKPICVVLTGAGISAESGIPTFRAEDGLWAGHKVEEVCTPEALKKNRAKVLAFYNERRRNAQAAEPNADTLKERLVGRQTETMEVINKRLSKAAEETGVIDKYDYFVINDEIADCAARINDIVTDNNPELIGSDCVNKIKNDILKFSKGE